MTIILSILILLVLYKPAKRRYWQWRNALNHSMTVRCDGGEPNIKE